MDKLEFTKTYQYIFKKEIYYSEENQSGFYEGFDNTEKRIVGIKKQKVSRKYLPQAQAEANVINTLSNETTGIPAIYNTYYDFKEEYFYIIMQLIQGGTTLRQYMSAKFPISQNIDTMIKVLDVLSHLHRKRYQHRDIKPENILVKDNKVYIIDFNLTAALPFKGEGTNHYRAPEQMERIKNIGLNQIDIFSIGVILYEMVTGSPPERGVDYSYRANMLEWRSFVEPIEKNPTIPQALNDCITKCLKLNPKERFYDANQLKMALIQIKRSLRS